MSAANLCPVCARPIADEARRATTFTAPGPSPADFCFAEINRRPCFSSRVAPSMSTPEPAPTAGTGDMWLLVLDDMRARREFGIAKYGTPLQVGNGRDHLVDLYQELL